MAVPNSSKLAGLSRRYVLGTVLGISVGLLTMFMIGRIVPIQVSPATASNFFFAAAGVNATLLVAISVTIPSILLKQRPGHRRTMREVFLTAQLMVVFLGLVTAGMGILYFDPTLPFNAEEFKEFVYLVFGTWVVSFALLISGIWAALPQECAEDG